MAAEPKPTRPGNTVRAPIVAVANGKRARREDVVTTEEPLEIRVGIHKTQHSVTVTMRTPGGDFELAAGFLFTEGIVASRKSIARIRYCADPQNYNVVTVELQPGTSFDPQKFSRHVYTTSSCGVCGKASLEMVRAALPPKAMRKTAATPSDEILLSLPGRLREAQNIFSRTGGLHAAALFDVAGKLRLLREDVGRHNALDKVIGALLLENQLPVSNGILLVSGRASFELVQKTVMAGIPTMAAVGAPSSLAVALAREFGITLIGFLRDDRYNLYTE